MSSEVGHESRQRLGEIVRVGDELPAPGHSEVDAELTAGSVVRTPGVPAPDLPVDEEAVPEHLAGRRRVDRVHATPPAALPVVQLLTLRARDAGQHDDRPWIGLAARQQPRQ